MINLYEVTETNKMIEEENLDVRTITLGISLLDCIDSDLDRLNEKIYNKIYEAAKDLVKTGEEISREFGIPIVNKRISVTPIALIGGAACHTIEDFASIAKTLDKVAHEVGVNFLGGYSALVSKGMTPADELLIRSIPLALSTTERVCSSVNLGSTKTGINMDAVKLMGEMVRETAEYTKEDDSLGCAKLVVFCNAPDDNPFMAGAFHGVTEADAIINVGIAGAAAPQMNILDVVLSDEVVFHAVEMLTKLMETKDVAFYSVVNDDYARLFSASSEKARSLGNSIRYREMTDIYDALKEQKVYINKKMDEQYPLMARGIYEGEEVQMIVMMWGLSWEKMTLGQANFLTVVSYLIQNAVLRAQRYMQALEEKRYSQNSRILEPEAFESLVQAYMKAKLKNLVECVLIKVDVQNSEYQKTDEQMSGYMRDSDYMGMLPDGNLYVLLTNTTREGAVIVQDRFEKNGYKTEYVEMMSVCHRE